jgi:hypothetical protein
MNKTENKNTCRPNHASSAQHAARPAKQPSWARQGDRHWHEGPARHTPAEQGRSSGRRFIAAGDPFGEAEHSFALYTSPRT